MMLNGEKAMLDEMSRDKAKQQGEACRRFQSRVDVEMVDILVEWTQESARKRKWSDLFCMYFFNTCGINEQSNNNQK